MDRSFLSDKSVIAVSRKFVCIRLATYESASENAFLKKLNGSRGVQNTTFAVLSPDGSRTLVRPSRSPQFQFRTPSRLASVMNGIAGQYRAKSGTPSSLPTAANVRIGLNIAAADNLPLVVVYVKDKSQLRKLETALLPVAWGKRHAGRFTWATTADAKELEPIKGTTAKEGIYVVQPGRFGMKGSVLRFLSADSVKIKAGDALAAGAKAFQPKSTVGVREHISAGQRNAVFWRTKLPVTDLMESRARQRTIQAILRGVGR